MKILQKSPHVQDIGEATACRKIAVRAGVKTAL
jgi:hypothetical protein